MGNCSAKPVVDSCLDAAVIKAPTPRGHIHMKDRMKDTVNRDEEDDGSEEDNIEKVVNASSSNDTSSGERQGSSTLDLSGERYRHRVESFGPHSEEFKVPAPPVLARNRSRNRSVIVRRLSTNSGTASLGAQDPPICLTALAEGATRILSREYGMDATTSPRDFVIVMEGWNKCLAFKTMFSEALYNRWRLLVALEETENSAQDKLAYESSDDGDSFIHVSDDYNSSVEDLGFSLSATSVRKALKDLETCQDPVALRLGAHHVQGQDFLMGLLDACIRSLCPHSQTVQREAYRPLAEELAGNIVTPAAAAGNSNRNSSYPTGNSIMGLKYGTVDEYFRAFARFGITPAHWVQFCDAFLWAMETHNPYVNEQDQDDFELPRSQSVYARFVSTYVAKPAIQASLDLESEMASPVYRVCVKRFWKRMCNTDEEKAQIGETFYRGLLSDHPEFLDFFTSSDIDTLALHTAMTLDVMVRAVSQIGRFHTPFRGASDHLGEMHRRQKIPSNSFPVIGAQIIKTLQPFLQLEEERTKNEENPVTAEQLSHAFAVLYTELMALVVPPVLREEKLIAEAEEFYFNIAEELHWSEEKLSKRLLEVKVEINSTGTYRHTTEELEIGARLAWRNSAKCIGRIAWDTLLVRDCRHVTKPKAICREVEEHLRIATCGENIQSVMTIFRPRSRNETWGLRFWSSQYVRFAGYQLDSPRAHPAANEDGILGDPANLEFTEYLTKNHLWFPPENISAFDPLPLVLKIPGRRKPYVYNLPKKFVQMVDIEHPDYPGIKDLGLKWAAVPAISNFNMNLGGINYNCSPFNGWFVSIEIVRNLMERYKIQDRWIQAMKLQPTEKRMIEMRVQHEVQIAVLHSFDKSGFTIVDPSTVGKSFLVHCKREQSAGRECPAQWSWIGGLVGPTNVTWHHEMRDFRVAPQYEYACDPWKVTDLVDKNGDDVHMFGGNTEMSTTDLVSEFDLTRPPSVLILFGSQTGKAEAAASKLARTLRMLRPTVMCLNDVAGLQIVRQRRITHIFAICSTFNRGEFPSDAVEFERTPIADGLLSATQVAVLALGSKSYADYCAAGVRLNSMLSKAGAREFMTITKVDDSVGSAGPIDDWLKLVKRLILPPHMPVASFAGAHEEGAPSFSLEWETQIQANPAPESAVNPFTSVVPFAWSEKESSLCVEKEELMPSSTDDRSASRLTFELPGGVTYDSGDHLAVHPLNSVHMVRRFAMCFKHELVGDVSQEETAEMLWRKLHLPMQVMEHHGDMSFAAVGLAFKCPTSLSDVLQSCVDLSLQDSMLEEFCRLMKKVFDAGDGAEKKNHDERKKLYDLFDKVVGNAAGTNAEKQSAIESFLSLYPTVVDFLEAHEVRTLPLVDLLVVLPRLRERYYSISSSPQADPRRVSITAGLVSFVTKDGKRVRGVCSGYLKSVQAGHQRVKVSVRKSSFRGPPSVDSSVIMVGPGTGLAPMMGFLHDRAVAMENNEGVVLSKCHLFYGCRSPGERIYTEQVDEWEEKGVIEHHLALSRCPKTPKTYVQHLMQNEKNAERMASLLLEPDSHYYVCGDAQVANECYEVCIALLRKHGNMSRVGAVQHIKRMRASNRWQHDIWGKFHGFHETMVTTKIPERSAKAWLMSFS